MGSIAKIGLTPTTQGNPRWNGHIDDREHEGLRVVVVAVGEAWDCIVFSE
jgi:hypothetical protein